MKKFQISADRPLNIFLTFIWFLLNYFRNLKQRSVDKNLITKKVNKVDLNFASSVSVERSPSRRVSDIFWKSIPIDIIVKFLGSVKILEVGCGNGNYGNFMFEIFNNNLEHYTGVDIVKSAEWNNFDKSKFTFIEGSADNYIDYFNQSNLIITQSALEHFPNDTIYFDQILNYTNSTKEPVIQIHLMPSSACLKLYLLHGYRQYTPYYISKITNTFPPKTRKILYSLGGKYLNEVHFKYWTKTFFTKKKRNLLDYNNHFLNALEKDLCDRSNIYDASFYCLVLFHNMPDELYEKFLSDI
jgi:SAM-dependent methyltransferase